MAEIKTTSRHFSNTPPRVLAYALLGAVLVAFGLHAVFIAGPSMRAAAHENLTQTISAEDRQFCERFGMRAGSDAFAACSTELSLVRQKQSERDKAAAEGIF